jgi:protein subunit release factor A
VADLMPATSPAEASISLTLKLCFSPQRRYIRNTISAQSCASVQELLDMAQSESDEETANSVIADLETIEISIARLEFQRMFNGKLDMNHAYLDIQSGSGGTEAQDWAEMVLRMYLRWGEKHNFKVKLMEASAGEVATNLTLLDFNIDIVVNLRGDEY